MLVEDDNNLREIYGARLQAEGYEIVSAKDGEEALAMAVKERPDLIVSDVMMPKISGFDMLDILRSTPETKHTKVIMMTALSQKEDQERGETLGADRYLVKSQVTLEDVVRVVGEVIAGTPENGTSETPAAEPAVAAAAPAAMPEPAQPAPAAAPAPEPTVPAVAAAPEPATSNEPDDATRHNRVIEPLNDPVDKQAEFNELVAAEEARENLMNPTAIPTETMEQEAAEVQQQIDAFATDTPAPEAVAAQTETPELIPSPIVDAAAPAAMPEPAPSPESAPAVVEAATPAPAPVADESAAAANPAPGESINPNDISL